MARITSHISHDPQQSGIVQPIERKVECMGKSEDVITAERSKERFAWRCAVTFFRDPNYPPNGGDRYSPDEGCAARVCIVQ